MPRTQEKYTRTVYPYIPSSIRGVKPTWTISKPITVIQLFNTFYILRGGYYNLYIFRCSVCNTWLFFEFSSVAIPIFLLKYAWTNSKVFLLALKRMSLNYATGILVHIFLNKARVLISPTLIIKGIASGYIVSSVTITARGLFLICSSFCTLFFLEDVPACFWFALIPKCAVWNWILTKLLLCFRLELLFQ